MTAPLDPHRPTAERSPHRPSTTDPSRRRFLALLGAGVGGLAGGGALLTRSGVTHPFRHGDDGTASAGTALRLGQAMRASTAAGPQDGRVLVLVELSGGNDGLATLVPYADAAYQRLRPDLGRSVDELVLIDDHVGAHGGLAPLLAWPTAFVEGVGIPDGSGSHFEMEQRWWAGDQSGIERHRAGFVGRLCDRLRGDEPITGVGLGGPLPTLVSEHATTIGMNDPWSAWFLVDDDPWLVALRDGMARLADGGDEDQLYETLAREGLDDALRFAEVLRAFEREANRSYPDTAVGYQLGLASTLIRSGSGVRVIHLRQDGYDTHEDQQGTHDYLMMELADGLAAFLADMADSGLADSTLVATASEFGRRPQENGSGTDHGAASVALLAGPVVPGRHGEPPSLTRLTDDDNLATTVPMQDYLATLATSWFGLEPGSAMPSRAEPIAGLIA